MKLPKLPKIAFPRRPKKLLANTAAARRAPAMDDYYDDEPKTNLSSAFVVVLILHVVAVGGIYAFNSIKAARRGPEQTASAAAPPATGTPLIAKAAATASEPGLPEPGANSRSAAESSRMTKDSIYQVKPGDNLTRIAHQHGITVADLEEANGLKNATSLRAGQLLTIPKPLAKSTPTVVQDVRKTAFLSAKAEATPPAVSAAMKASGRSYTVAKGDTPMSIARKFGISSSELLKLNKIDDPKKMQIGQSLKLPARKTN